MNSNNSQQGVLYVVATPIGNLGDLSQRAREILSQVNRIAAEDTRRTRGLLSHIGVNTPCFSVHDHNERQKIDYIVQLLNQGESIALVSDAGTPLISDPGYPLVHELRKLGMKVVPIPGACAMIAALSVAGLPSDRFIFEGFLPSKKVARQTFLAERQNETATLIFYESSHRIIDTLSDILAVFGPDRRVVLARELTKTFETILDAPIAELCETVLQDPNQAKGEFVVLIQGASKKTQGLEPAAQKLARLLAVSLSGKEAAKIVAEMFECKKNEVYQFLLESKDS